MTQAAPKLLTFDEFVARYGDNERYELIDRELIDMEPTGPHEEVAAFVLRKVNVEDDRCDRPSFPSPVAIIVNCCCDRLGV
jgi:Uma2 family endonuclease